jgi:hypothetical protein
MSESFVGLRYLSDGDGTGKLLVHVQNAQFRGASSAWFGEDELLAFAHSLATSFPLKSGEKPSIQAGFPYAEQAESEFQQVHVAITVYPVGTTGAIGVQIKLATPLYEGERPDSQSAVVIELLTRYGPLQDFGHQLQALVQGAVEHAKLSAYEA